MLRVTTIFLDTEHMKQLGTLAKAQGLKTAQLVRVAIAEYIQRERRKQAAQIVPGRARRQAVIGE
jgi:predicted transcriptional regulator